MPKTKNQNSSYAYNWLNENNLMARDNTRVSNNATRLIDFVNHELERVKKLYGVSEKNAMKALKNELVAYQHNQIALRPSNQEVRNPIAQRATTLKVNKKGDLQIDLEGEKPLANPAVEPLNDLFYALTLGSGAALNTAKAVPTTLSAIANNPLGRSMVYGTIGGEGVNLASLTLTGRNFGENVENATYGVVPSWVGDFINPGYFINPVNRFLTPTLNVELQLMNLAVTNNFVNTFKDPYRYLRNKYRLAEKYINAPQRLLEAIDTNKKSIDKLDNTINKLLEGITRRDKLEKNYRSSVYNILPNFTIYGNDINPTAYDQLNWFLDLNATALKKARDVDFLLQVNTDENGFNNLIKNNHTWNTLSKNEKAAIKNYRKKNYNFLKNTYATDPNLNIPEKWDPSKILNIKSEGAYDMGLPYMSEASTEYLLNPEDAIVGPMIIKGADGRPYVTTYLPREDIVGRLAHNMNYTLPEFGTNNSISGSFLPKNYNIESEMLVPFTPSTNRPVIQVNSLEDYVWPTSNLEYQNLIDKNTKYVLDRFPGVKMFGSTVLAKNGLPHGTHDFDTITTEKAFKELLKKYQFNDIRNGNTFRTRMLDAFDKSYGEAGDIDVNVIHEDANGMATGELAWELYRLLYPRETAAIRSRVMNNFAKNLNIDDLKALSNESSLRAYIQKLMLESMDRVELNKTPEELLESYDPEMKTLIDAFDSKKEKHMSRALADILLYNPKKVSEALSKYRQILLDGEGWDAPTTLEMFLDKEANSRILDMLDKNVLRHHTNDNELKSGLYKRFFGAAVDKPEIMKNIVDYYYLHNGIYGRGVKIQDLPEDIVKNKGLLNTIDDAYRHWFGVSGGTANGIGENTVTLGGSAHGNIYGYILPKINFLQTNNGEAFVDDIQRLLGAMGRIPEGKEKDAIAQIWKDNFGTEIPKYTSLGDLIYGLLHSISSKLFKQSKLFLQDLNDKLGIRAIATGNRYGNSIYNSMTGDVTNSEDVVVNFPNNLLFDNNNYWQSANPPSQYERFSTVFPEELPDLYRYVLKSPNKKVYSNSSPGKFKDSWEDKNNLIRSLFVELQLSTANKHFQDILQNQKSKFQIVNEEVKNLIGPMKQIRDKIENLNYNLVSKKLEDELKIQNTKTAMKIMIPVITTSGALGGLMYYNSENNISNNLDKRLEYENLRIKSLYNLKNPIDSLAGNVRERYKYILNGGTESREDNVDRSNWEDEDYINEYKDSINKHEAIEYSDYNFEHPEEILKWLKEKKNKQEEARKQHAEGGYTNMTSPQYPQLDIPQIPYEESIIDTNSNAFKYGSELAPYKRTLEVLLMTNLYVNRTYANNLVDNLSKELVLILIKMLD